MALYLPRKKHQHQTLVLLMVLGSEDVGRCRMAEPIHAGFNEVSV
jgi:hypothetical protein